MQKETVIKPGMSKDKTSGPTTSRNDNRVEKESKNIPEKKYRRKDKITIS
jgi:hypothetical protein